MCQKLSIGQFGFLYVLNLAIAGSIERWMLKTLVLGQEIDFLGLWFVSKLFQSSKDSLLSWERDPSKRDKP